MKNRNGEIKGGTLHQRAGKKLAEPLKELKAESRWADFGTRLPLYDYFHSTHVQKEYPREYLAIAWRAMPNATPHEVLKEEQKTYYNYRQEFGERPPFNRNFGMGQHIKEEERDHRGPLSMPDQYYSWIPQPRSKRKPL